MNEIKDFENNEFPEHNEYVYVLDDVEQTWKKHGFDRSMGIYKFFESDSSRLEHLPVNRFHKWSKEKPVEETKSKYRVGFVLQIARCLNCEYQWKDYDSVDFYELKESIFEIVEKHHEKQNALYHTDCPKRELLIRFGNAVRESFN